jgi:hypothetical protein
MFLQKMSNEVLKHIQKNLKMTLIGHVNQTVNKYLLQCEIDLEHKYIEKKIEEPL